MERRRGEGGIRSRKEGDESENEKLIPWEMLQVLEEAIQLHANIIVTVCISLL